MVEQRNALSGWVARLLRRGQVDAGTLPRAAAVAEPTRLTPNAEQQVEFEQGLERFRAQQYDRALLHFEAAIVLKHDWADAHYYAGVSQHRLGCFEEACDAFAMALCFAPDMTKAHYALALAERKLGRSDAALASVERSLGGVDQNADAFNLRGALLLERGDIAAALTSFERAVEANPAHAIAHSNLGYLLFRDCGEYDLGAAHIERSLALDPGNADSQCNYTMVLSHRGEHDRALALCDRLLLASPGLHEARLNRALVLLKLGRFESGWDDYEARKSVRSNFVARNFAYPDWRGEALEGKTILVHGEQGLGDEIMFASCFGDLIDRAGHCVIECAPALERLFRRSFPEATVFAGDQNAAKPAWLERAPQIHVQSPAGSLPLHFRRSAKAFPLHQGYLVPDPARVAYWRDRLAALGPGLKVGISWRGGMQSTRRTLRSIDLEAWGPLLRQAGAHFVSLQYGDTAIDRDKLARAHGLRLTCWQDGIDDMDETAALIAGLDLVVSVCTAVIHLAGAIGRRAWVLVPASAEWRYQAYGDTMPWYPSVRLYRQQVAGDWLPAIDDVARCLRDLAGADCIDR